VRQLGEAVGDGGHAVDHEAGRDIDLDWHRWWAILPEIVIALCAAAIPVLVGIDVVARYTGWFFVFWVHDVVKVLFLWLVFLGGAVATKYGAHVRIAMLSDRIEALGGVGRLWRRAIALSPIVVGAILLVLGVPLTSISMTRELPSLHIPAGYFTMVVPLSGALMIYYVVHNELIGNRLAGAD
jgi:TRAP-type C4-dicarboxylate transport system permease small subunit